MGLYNAFADSINRRLVFIDHFRSLAGVSSESVIKMAAFTSSGNIDSWLLDANNPEVNRVLTDAGDPLLALVIRQSQTWAQECARRLADRPSFLGDIASTHLLNSDPHVAGIPIAIVFEGGNYVYKPRPVKLDQLYNNFVNVLRSVGAKHVPNTARVIDCGEYGYIEYIQARKSPVSLINEEIRSVGAILAIIYMMAGKDFHYENVIFSESGGATLIDLEGLLQPDVQQDATPVERFTSILSTGILPARVSSGQSFDFDPSIIGSKVYDLGAKLDEAAAHFQEGFAETYKCILQNMDFIKFAFPYDDLKSTITRYIISNTVDYYRAISQYIYNDALGKGAEFLAGIHSSTANGESFLRHERASIAHLCVPIFYSDNASRQVFSERGDKIFVEVQLNGLEKSYNRLNVQMSFQDLTRQLWFIALSFELYAINNRIEMREDVQKYLQIKGDFTNIIEITKKEMELLDIYIKMTSDGSHIVVFPYLEEGLWVLKDRKLYAEEVSIRNLVIGLINEFDIGTARRSQSDLLTVIGTLRKLENTEEYPFVNGSDSELFEISARCGPCAELFDAFSMGKPDVADFKRRFVEKYNAAAQLGQIVYSGGLRSRDVRFGQGLICLIVALLIVAFVTAEESVLYKDLGKASL